MCCGLLSTHQVVKEANCFLFSRVNFSLWELSFFLGMMASGSYLLLSLHLAIEWCRSVWGKNIFGETKTTYTHTHTRWWAAIPSPWAFSRTWLWMWQKVVTPQSNKMLHVTFWQFQYLSPRACIRLNDNNEQIQLEATSELENVMTINKKGNKPYHLLHVNCIKSLF